MFSFQETRGSIEVAFTDRHGGVSDGPYASLNLAEPQVESQAESQAGPTPSGADGNRRAEVRRNLDLLTRAFTARDRDTPLSEPAPVLVRMHQVHGADVHVVDRAWLDSDAESPPVADGLVTDLPGVILLVRVADCVPVLLADPDSSVVGAAHAGRNGLVAGIVPNTIARMHDLGARRVVAWVGPHVCGRCYEVPASMREEVAAAVPESFAETSWGTPALDVGAGVLAQLATAGAEIVDASRCTVEDDDLFSYRRQGAASGRLGGLVRVRP